MHGVALQARAAGRVRLADQAAVSFLSAASPNSEIIRFRLSAITWRLISALTLQSVLARKCVAPIQALIVENGCSTVRLRMVMAFGMLSSRPPHHRFCRQL